VLAESYALAREAADRVLGMRPFDVQILAALALNDRNVVEMQTGEGKTLAAVLPATLQALGGRGLHVLTFNDYLARRDAEWMGPVYRFLGLEVSFVQEGMTTSERRQAYLADVTYVTAKEAGFDFLRDGLARSPRDLVHRPFHFAILDEVDSLLIDEGRVPLVLAGNITAPESPARRVAELVRSLEDGVDYGTDEYGRNVQLTERGLDRAGALLGCGDLLAAGNLELLTALNCALHAAVLLMRDVDYILRDGQIQLVDEFTGRVVEDRHWPDGLQAALEAKEGIERRPAGRILGSITIQHFVRLYPGVCGMTGTAQTSAEEFKETYGLDVVVIPTNRPCIRKDHPDVLFTHKEAKRHALVDEIRRVHATGRPILVGTSSVEESEQLASSLRDLGVACQVLNARRDDLEAEIIAEAGAPGAVTISTNMAGRGTDIRLGGSRQENRERVVALGGLYVIGTNRHESQRVDQQLRGRAGRQGDPGLSRFYLSLEDELLARFGIERLVPRRLFPERQDEPLDSPVIRREVARAQRIANGQNFDIRRALTSYSSQIEEQRKIVHRRRRDVLLGRGEPHLLARNAPRRYRELAGRVGEEATRSAERRVTLFHIDHFWSEHLAEIGDLREGIHLVRVGGQDPLTEFGRRAAESFQDLSRRIDEAVVRTLQSARITAQGIDLSAEGLRGPSSTWTYLVNDDPFRSQLGVQLLGPGNFGAAAGAALLPFGLLLMAWGIYNRFVRSRRGARSAGRPG
jgi:preprotein translocase subunit SecA